MNEELKEWLERNKIQFSVVDDEVIHVRGFGKMYVEDTDHIKSIFRIDADNNVKFNSMENILSLQDEDINYIIFKFGDNWYYYDTRKDFSFNILKYIGDRKPTERTEKFVNLGVHTPFELLNGSFGIPEWIKKAKYLGQTALGICDYNTMAATLILQKECDAAGITPVFGYSLTFTDGNDEIGAKIYCQTQKGLQNLMRIQKVINVDSETKIIDLQDLMKYGEGNIIVFDKYSGEWLSNITNDMIDQLFDSFKDCFFQLDLSEYKAERIDIRVLESARIYFRDVYKYCDFLPVLISDCYYLDKDDAKNKVILNKIATGAAHEQSDDQYFKDLDEHWNTLKDLFSDDFDVDHIFRGACARTVEIAEGAKARFEIDRNFMPQYDMTPEEKEKYGDRHTMFLQLLQDGFKKLVPAGKEEEYRERLEYEIYVLESTNNVDYMLVQYDTVNYARSHGVLVGCGRGSAGGCLILYLLGITLIDPIKYDLIFERFLLPERAGLYPSDVTVVGQDIETQSYVEVTLENGKTYKIWQNAEILVQREGMEEPIKIYADQIQEGDNILFDNRDVLFTLNEI